MAKTQSQNSETEWVKEKSYPLTVEADRVLTEMKTKFKTTKQELISEAIIRFAKEKGIKVKGAKGANVKRLSTKLKKQERTIAALSRLVLEQCSSKNDLKEALDIVGDAVDSGVKTAVRIKKNYKEELPTGLRSNDAVTALLAALPK